VPLDRALARLSGSGLAWALVEPDGIEVHVRGVAQDAAFEWGSITKTVTGTLLALLSARGVVGLRTPLSDLVPGARALALEDLASHTSGLPRLLPGSLRFVRATWRQREDPYAGVDEEQLVADLRRTRLRRGGYRYSNAGHGLLGLALGRATGRSYEELVQEHVCGPLGLTSVTTGDRPELVQGHTRRGTPTPHWHFADALAGCGALRGSARDLGRWVQAAGGQAPEPLRSALEEALRPRARTRSFEVGLGWNRSALAGVAGLRAPTPGEPAVRWHNGGTGGFRAFAAHDEGSGRAVAVLAAANRSVDGLGVLLLRPERG
jgi:D-alanyl-D-alanine-carboxypeptidase/D-alanyl-D-alanine-endopeptidase